MRPFGCPFTFLNTKDHLGKFNSKADKGFFVGYSLNSKAFRVFNYRTRIVKENLHIRFSEYTPNVVGSGPDWLFDIDAPTRTMNYEPIIAGTKSNGFEDPKSSFDDGFKPSSDDEKNVDEDPRQESECKDQEKENNAVGKLPFDPDILALEDVRTFNFSNEDEDDDEEADMNNLDTTIQVSSTPTTRIHKDHPLDKVIRDFQLATQTRNMTKNLEEHRSKLDRGYAGRASTKFKLQKVWTLVDLPNGKRAIGTKWSLGIKRMKEGKINVKIAFLYEKIKEEVYVCQPLGFKDPDFPDRVYKVEKALYGRHQDPRAWFIEVKNESTPIETQKPLLEDEDGEEVDVHMYRSMIDLLMYLTSTRPGIMFVVYAYARYQVNSKVHIFMM
uniref:Uncharacterized protein n=1 Tax=Tanacetum cinerariifolium TaxID=118510 RepID=A0A699IBM2_TANCI|nr:hypothetical protein [Tanacetum cinerariifolium]